MPPEYSNWKEKSINRWLSPISQNPSRYEECEASKDDGQEHTGVRLPAETQPRPDDRFHTVVSADGLDVRAHRYLGDANLWWLICECNGIPFPLELPTG
jgi:hypothetical protein